MGSLSSYLDAGTRAELSRDTAEFPATRPRPEESGASLVRRGLMRSAANDEDRAEVRRLAATVLVDAERKPWLRYVHADVKHLGKVLVGCEYVPGDGALVTSASTEPPQREDITVEEVWLRGVEIIHALSIDALARATHAALLQARSGVWA